MTRVRHYKPSTRLDPLAIRLRIIPHCDAATISATVLTTTGEVLRKNSRLLHASSALCRLVPAGIKYVDYVWNIFPSPFKLIMTRCLKRLQVTLSRIIDTLQFSSLRIGGQFLSQISSSTIIFSYCW